jgi:hypothetical protein
VGFKWQRIVEDIVNTANLQLEGLLLAFGAMNRLLVEKGIATHQEVNGALADAERAAIRSVQENALSPANRKATMFPIRLLLLANEAAEQGKDMTFADYAEMIGKLD